MKSLSSYVSSASSYVSSARQRVVALFHRTDQLKSQSAERKQRWNQVIAEYQKPLGPGKPAEKTDKLDSLKLQHLGTIKLQIDDTPLPEIRNIAYFDVDERGNTTLLSFNPSRDSGYNKKIREMLLEFRFRPAVRADGTPVRDTTWISAEAP